MNTFNFNGPIGSAQIGNHNSMVIQQNNGADIKDIIQVFSQMRQDIRSLPQEQQAEAERILARLEEESEKDTPEPSVLESLGSALWGIAGPVLAEGAKEYLKQKLGINTG